MFTVLVVIVLLNGVGLTHNYLTHNYYSLESSDRVRPHDHLNTGRDSNQWLSHRVYRKSLDPDNWQTVEKNISYVYSAHLHPDSNDIDSVVQILGAMREKEFVDKNCTFQRMVHCRLWSWPRSAKEPVVNHVRVDMARVLRRGQETR